MLQSIRNKASGWFALVLISLVLFTMLFFGVGDYLTTQTDTYVAKVGDEEISQNTFRQRFEEWRQNMRQQMGESYNAEMFQQPAFKRQMLDQMVNEAVIRQANERLDLVVPVSRLRAEIMSAPVFQINGRFDEQAYRNFLDARGQTPAGFDRQLSDSFAVQLLPAAVQSSALVTDQEVDAYLRLSEQLRDFSFVRVGSPADAVDDEISPDELQSFYDANSAEFMTPESVTVEYVELDATTMPSVGEPSEGDLRDRYETEKNRFGTVERRLVSHILVKTQGDDADAQKAALDKASALAARARGDGADFSALAKEASDDLGTKELGGDLGWVERGLTDPVFEDALFAMEAVGISDPVRSDEGYHVIQLREITPASQKSFEEVREELATEYTQSENERLYAERSGELIDLIYKEPGSLAPAAEALGLEIRTAGPFTRESGEGLFANPALREAAFSDMVLVEGNISDPVELDESHMVALRLTDHAKSEPRPLADVSEEIRTRIVAERRAEALKARAEALFARVQDGETLTALATEIGVEVETADATGRMAATPERALVNAAFSMQRPVDEPTYQLVNLGSAYAIAELRSVKDGDPATVEAARKDQVRSELEQSYASAEAQALIASLRAGSEITIAEDRLQ
jgi:peptidyl-prolyl cis-trans isomerase D